MKALNVALAVGFAIVVPLAILVTAQGIQHWGFVGALPRISVALIGARIAGRVMDRVRPR